MFYSVVFDRGARHSTAVGGDMDVGTGCAGDVDAWEYKLHAKNTHPLAWQGRAQDTDRKTESLSRVALKGRLYLRCALSVL